MVFNFGFLFILPHWWFCVFLCFFLLLSSVSFHERSRPTEIGARDGTGRTLRFAFSREEGRGETGSCGWFC